MVTQCQPELDELRQSCEELGDMVKARDAQLFVAEREAATLQARVNELTRALTEIDTLATCTGVVDPALHRNMLDNIYRIARRGLAMPLEQSGSGK